MAPAAPKQSLAAQSGALTNTFKMPAIFQPPAAPLEGRAMAPYVVFAHANKKDEWNKLVSKFGNGVSDGDTFLIEPDGVTPLPTIKCSVVTYRKFYSAKDNAGKMTSTSEVETPLQKNENVEAVIFVYLEDRAVVANVQFRTTKCGGVVELSRGLAEAKDPSWASKSELHKQTLVAAEPFLRFYGELTVQPPRTPKGGGMPYRPCACSGIKPTTAAEWKLAKEFFESANAVQMFDLAAKRFESQCAEVTRLLVKS